jgi:hypothetical protein
MDEFSFLSVLISVILGLAVTEILQGFRRVTAVANTHSNLLAGDWVGFPGTPRLF